MENHIGSVFDTEQGLLQSVLKIHAPQGIELDPMYFKGNFYKEISKPKLIFDIEPQTEEISKAVVETAVKENAGIKLEKLEGIRKNRKHSRSFNYSLNSWSFYQLQQFIEYKAGLNGIPLTYIEPKYTSQECSRCGDMGIRDSKKFVCNNCRHVDHADANAAFNISLRPPIGEKGTGQLNADRDAFKGSTDTPQGATL